MEFRSIEWRINQYTDEAVALVDAAVVVTYSGDDGERVLEIRRDKEDHLQVEASMTMKISATGPSVQDALSELKSALGGRFGEEIDRVKDILQRMERGLEELLKPASSIRESEPPSANVTGIS